MKLSDLENYVAGLRHVANESGNNDPQVAFVIGQGEHAVILDIEHHAPVGTVYVKGNYAVPMKPYTKD